MQVLVDKHGELWVLKTFTLILGSTRVQDKEWHLFNGEASYCLGYPTDLMAIMQMHGMELLGEL
jgi:hypothetical protein